MNAWGESVIPLLAYYHDFRISMDGVWIDNRIYFVLTERNYKQLRHSH
jgi:hypothetical protein